MSMPIAFDDFQRRKALNKWLADCKKRMAFRFPKVDFDSDAWPIKTLYGADLNDFYFTESLADLINCDKSYREALRCLAAEHFLCGKTNNLQAICMAFRVLAKGFTQPIFNLSIQDLRRFEVKLLNKVRENPGSAATAAGHAYTVERTAHLLARKGVTATLGFFRKKQFKAELHSIIKVRYAKRLSAKTEILDHQMEAFNQAFNAMIKNTSHKDGTPVLNSGDKLAICAVAIGLCAPSRINEVLTMSINDYITVEDYAGAPATARNMGIVSLSKAHQMLIITQKGSKGAEWGPKPVLQFMIDVFHYCIEKIKELSVHSRMLTEWYQMYPKKLYLSVELEYLRGQVLNKHDLGKIIFLESGKPSKEMIRAGTKMITALKGKSFQISNPNILASGDMDNAYKKTLGVNWADAEEYLLARVHKAMHNCRRVTTENYFIGDLANMLFLYDINEMPFLPHAVSYQYIRRRLKRINSGKAGYETPPTIFEKLNITMPVKGKIEFAHLSLHDPRRWLSTQALKHGENLSDVLINKWANRCNLVQLKAYDFRTAEMMAEASVMPESQQLTQLSDLSSGLGAVEKLEEQFGLQTAIVTAQHAGIAVTSMDAISQAIEDRPVANSSRGIIVIYPQRFGACLHQHHETPCRNYSNDLSASCMTCNEAVHVKGHIPTNDATRNLAKKLFTSIIRHLENLARTHNRNVADDPAALGEHMVMLVEKGLNPIQLEQLASELINNFHEIKDLLKDRQLANRLEQAFVARGVMQRLDNQDVLNGALIKYHNPIRHSQPLMEIALDKHGGRAKIQEVEASLIAKHPIFAPVAEELKDERHLIEPDDDEEDI